MSPQSNPTILATRDAITQLLNDTAGVLTWPVRLALSSAFNYLDDTLPGLTPPPKPPGEPSQRADVVTVRIETLRGDLLGLLENLPDDIDPYAIGHAAGELGTALRELTTGRPA